MNISRETKIGLLVASSIGLLVFGFNFLKGKNIFFKRDKYYAVYEKIDGLVESNPVQINGFTVGQVRDIYFHPDNSGRIIVSFVMKDTEFKIPKNTIARVISADFLGSKAIQLVLGNSQQYYQDGDTLIAGIQASLTEEVNKQVLPLKNKAEKLIGSIDSVLAVVQYIFNEESTQNIKNSFESINDAITTLKKTSIRIDTLVSEQRVKFLRISSNLESITNNVRNNNEKITKVINNFSSLSDTLLKANIASTISNTNKTLTQVADITEKINKGEGTLGLLLNNDSLYNNLNSASKDLDLLLEDMRVNPSRYVHFSVFGRKEKPKTEEPKKK